MKFRALLLAALLLLPGAAAHAQPKLGTAPSGSYDSTAASTKWATDKFLAKTGQPRITDPTFPALDFYSSSGIANRRTMRLLQANDGTAALQFYNDDFTGGRNAFTVNAQSAAISFAQFGLQGRSMTFQPGNQVDGGFGTMRQDWRLDDGIAPVGLIGGYWPGGKTYAGLAISRTFDSGASPGNTPHSALWVYSGANGTTEDVVGAMVMAESQKSFTTVYGANVLALGRGGLSNLKMVGMEIDVQPAAGVSTAPGSAGIYVNAFSSFINGSAIQFGGVGGGNFANGIGVGGLATNGSGLYGLTGAVMGNLVNTGPATYLNNNAIVMSGNHFIQFGGASTMRLGLDGSNNMVMPVANNFAFKKYDNSATLLNIDGGSGQMTSPSLVGSGNAQVCVNASGAMYRGSPGC